MGGIAAVGDDAEGVEPVRAQGVLALAAALAGAARVAVQRRDAVAGLPPGDVGTDREHAAGGLVAQRDGQRHEGDATAPIDEIAVADAAGLDRDHDLVAGRCGGIGLVFGHHRRIPAQRVHADPLHAAK